MCIFWQKPSRCLCCGGSARCVFRGRKSADQQSFGSASVGGKVGSVNGRMGAGNENQQQERKKKQSLDVSLMSDSLNCICPSDNCRMMNLAGWFFERSQNQASRRRSSGGISAFHRLGITDSTLVFLLFRQIELVKLDPICTNRWNWADLYFKKIMKPSFRGTGLSGEESNYTSLSG